MRRWLAALTTAVLLVAPGTAADIDALLQRLRAVGPEGAGNAEAAAAWAELSRQSVDALPRLLAGCDGASPTAANWILSAVESIVERERAAHRPSPAAVLEAFVRDTNHDGKARRLAYELLCSADVTASQRLLPGMLHDPGPELRYEAVAVALDRARQQPKESPDAKAALRQLLNASRDHTQIEAIAQELAARGDAVDLVAHFGYLTHWQIAGVFDNNDGRGFRTAYPPESGVDLSTKYRGKDGREVVWRPLSLEKTGVVDLNKLFPDPKRQAQGERSAVAYAYTVVESPAERSVEVRAASATALKVFVNGREVLAREHYHQSFDPDSHVGPARLRQGRNTILVKVCQNGQTEPWAQNWMFQLRLTDALGAAVPLTALRPEEFRAGGAR